MHEPPQYKPEADEEIPLLTVRSGDDDDDDIFKQLNIFKLTQKKISRLVAFAVVNLFVITNTIMLFVWLCYYEKISSTEIQKGNLFPLHPLFMIFGFTILPSNAFLIYRYKILPLPKLAVKLIHVALFALSILMGITGLLAIIVTKNRSWHDKHLYSMHSWFGLVTLTIYSLQFVFGFTILLFPLPENFKTGRKFYKMTHKFTGLFLVFLPLITIASGAAEHSMSGKKEFSPLNIFSNFVFIFTLILISIVLFFLKGPGKVILKESREQLTRTIQK